jgi:hypothetical protein
MASKGKSKVPKIEPEFRDAVEAEKRLVQQQLTEGERSRMVELAPETGYVMAVDRQQSLPSEAPTKPTQVMRPEKGEPCTDHAGMTENFCLKCGMPLQDVKSDGGGYRPYPVSVPEPWATRLFALAKQANMSPQLLIETLIKKQWIASGAGKRAK